MKIKALIMTIATLMFCTLTGYCVDENSTDANVTAMQNEHVLFEDRFVYFDRAIDNDDNYALLQKVVVDAQKLGFNALVLNEEFIYSRLSHENVIIDKIKKRFSEIEVLVHSYGMRLIVMHFNSEVPTFVVKDGDPANRFFQAGKFDFSEANKAESIYIVEEDEAKIDATPEKVLSPALLDRLYHFTNIKPNTEYKLTMNATTVDFNEGILKVSALDEDHKGENGKVIFGIQKYFRNIDVNATDKNYSVYFNSLNHENLNGAIKIFLAKKKGLTVNSLELLEVGYTKSEHIVRVDTQPLLESIDSNESNKTFFVEGADYILEDDKIVLLSQKIKEEKMLKLTWYPKIDVSRFYDHETTANICADERLYHDIMIDQFQTIKTTMNGNVDGIAFNNDEWREAGWDEKCQELYALEFKELNSTHDFTGGDYIGISTKRMIENLQTVSDTNESNETNASTMKFYVMSDMFDPNFNAKNPYMGVSNGAEGAVEYLPKETVILNWFPNPHEPGLEDKTDADFLKSAKHFSDKGLKQIIAGYHDDMNNLDANIAFYKDSDKEVQESIIGYMFLIWHQPNKTPSYDDMNDVVSRICKDLPGKWPQEVCDAIKK